MAGLGSFRRRQRASRSPAPSWPSSRRLAGAGRRAGRGPFRGGAVAGPDNCPQCKYKHAAVLKAAITSPGRLEYRKARRGGPAGASRPQSGGTGWRRPLPDWECPPRAWSPVGLPLERAGAGQGQGELARGSLESSHWSPVTGPDSQLQRAVRYLEINNLGRGCRCQSRPPATADFPSGSRTFLPALLPRQRRTRRL